MRSRDFRCAKSPSANGPREGAVDSALELLRRRRHYTVSFAAEHSRSGCWAARDPRRLSPPGLAEGGFGLALPTRVGQNRRSDVGQVAAVALGDRHLLRMFEI